MKCKQAVLLVVVALVGLVGFGCACARDTTVILVRHAEREAGAGQDPALTPAGQQRAEALVDVVRGAGVSAIYVTSFQRTRQTAAPTAQSLGLTTTMFPIDSTPEAHAAAIAADIREHHAGECVLVVGHSNTVPLILADLGVNNPPAIAEPEFDRVFVAVLRKDKATRLVQGRYGP
jgi:broad specificity phosphatase PhoE